MNWQIVLLLIMFSLCAPVQTAIAEDATPATAHGRYAPVNGLQMYYEIRGAGGTPLVLLHGGGSTIETSFGKVIDDLAKTRQVIAIEQQGHGHTADIDGRPFSFEQSADDTAELLRQLKIDRADFYGYSNGGHIALQIAMRHPSVVRKLVLISTFFKRDGVPPQFWEGFKGATLQTMPAELRDAYLRVAPHPEQLQSFFDKSVKRMVDFQNMPEADIKSIRAPSLIVIGDSDIVRPEHAVEMSRLLPHAQLAILPGTDHMMMVNRAQMLLAMIPQFLDAPMPKTE
jgi:pimeloyl-ACP methyl ester carboxylesterase